MAVVSYVKTDSFWMTQVVMYPELIRFNKKKGLLEYERHYKEMIAKAMKANEPAVLTDSSFRKKKEVVKLTPKE